jgi:RimJ/RimL family protein N-acetyltransferase
MRPGFQTFWAHVAPLAPQNAPTIIKVMESYRLPEEFQTPHYRLRRVTIEDAEAIFAAYAADPQVTRYLGWKTHRDLRGLCA